MSKIRVLSDHIANQIAAGEVVERPASVGKELVENSIDAGARRIEIDVEAGGRRLLRVADDGEGMTRDDAVLAFERHATSKISTTDDLNRISTLGFRGEALASIASVARVELITQTEGGDAATRVLVEGGRMRDVSPAARPRGTTISVRDLFFNVPARRKFLRSEATESFHLTNLVTHYALAHPEIAFVLNNNGRETLRAAPASDLRERAYQIFGAEFLENLLPVEGGAAGVARVRGYVSAPRERRISRDAQYLFVNGRYVRDRLISRALSEGYRSILPQGVYPAALLFLEVPLEEVDVNVHPAKTEVRFRRSAAVADAVRDAVRAALSSGGYVRESANLDAAQAPTPLEIEGDDFLEHEQPPAHESHQSAPQLENSSAPAHASTPTTTAAADRRDASSPTGKIKADEAERRTVGLDRRAPSPPKQETIEFAPAPASASSANDDPFRIDEAGASSPSSPKSSAPAATDAQHERLAGGVEAERSFGVAPSNAARPDATSRERNESEELHSKAARSESALPPLSSVAGLVREVPPHLLGHDIHPLGQLEESYIVATDSEGLLLVEQHNAHERILFDKYHALEATRSVESQSLLLPETFDLTPAQAAIFDAVSAELETYGFGLMRLSGRTVAVRAVPADLPAGEARNMLAEVLDTVEAERRTRAREVLREQIALALASRAAVKLNTPLTHEKMAWLLQRLLRTSSPTTCPHGQPIVLRLTTRDIAKNFQRS
ncbi:MAG TPA: DNA mismatch repair endonuclease MutL [Pyrinomonadaceae bacterium]|jgi:DNA mismatch repair protein MutL